MARTLLTDDIWQQIQSTMQFHRWASKGLWDKFFLNYEAYRIKNGYSLTEATYARISMQVARHGFERAIGQSRGGRTTKIHLATDANGLPIDFKITGGEVHDSQVAAQLICEIGQADYLIADKGYDSEKIRILATKQNIVPIIPMKSNIQRENKEFDRYLYRLRHLVENAFARLKHFRAIATRFDKLAETISLWFTLLVC